MDETTDQIADRYKAMANDALRRAVSDTPRTTRLYDEHKNFANEEEATEAVCDFRDLCRELERENAKLREEINRLANLLPGYGGSQQ